MRGVIDRFEGNKALVEIEGRMKIIPRGLLPNDAREGFAVVFTRGRWLVDKIRTEQLKQENQQLIDELWK